MSRFPKVGALVLVAALWSQTAAATGGEGMEAAVDPAPPAATRAIQDFLISGGNAVVDKNEIAVGRDSANDQYLVVWEDERNSGTRGSDIYGQLLAGDGAKIGFNFRISGPSATGNEGKPAVAFDPVGNRYLVVWSDSRDSGTRGTDIYGQRVKPGGNLAGGNFRISGAGATFYESYPEVDFDAASGQYLVVWSDSRSSSTRGSDIYGRRVKAGGKLAGGDFRISGAGAITDDRHPDVAFNPISGQYLVVWSDGRDSATRGLDVYGRRVKAGGKLAGGDFRISGVGATDNDHEPAVACDTVGGLFLVIWRDGRDMPTRDWDVYGRRVKAGGKLAGGDFRISGSAAITGDYYPAIAFEGANQTYLVVWQDGRKTGTRGRDIYGRRVKTGGSLAGGDFRISGSGATDDEMYPALAAYPACGRFMSVWIDARASGTPDWEVYGRRIDP